MAHLLDVAERKSRMMVEIFMMTAMTIGAAAALTIALTLLLIVLGIVK